MRFISTADWHIRSTPPACSAENAEEWMAIQKNMLDQIYDVCVAHACMLVVTGDLFNSNVDTTHRCITIIQDMAERLADEGLPMYYIAGNHDLPYHSSTCLDRSGIGVLGHSRNVYNLAENPIEGTYAANFDGAVGDAPVVFRHVLCFPSSAEMFPGSTDYTAHTLLQEYRLAKYLVIGDYHHGYVYKEGDRRVINPGCLTIQAEDMKGYIPTVYYVDTDIDTIEKIELSNNQHYAARAVKTTDDAVQTFAAALSFQTRTLDYVQNVRTALIEHPELLDTVERWITENRL